MDITQMGSQRTFSVLLQKLGYESSPNLVLNDDVPTELEITWREAKDKLGIDAVYFVANAPVIYFKQFEILDRESIIQLHRSVWNQSKVPLLFVILPGDIRVYNGYEAPGQMEGEPSRLDYELNSPDKRPPSQLWERLAIFTRIAIETGSFWRDYGDHFSRETRADQKLIANLRYIRRELIEAEPKLSPEHTHSLIGRSIFALYLQDRGALEDGFFAKEFEGKYSRYTDILVSYDDTYHFFDILRRFNGDMFPVTPEEKEAVHPEHFRLLHRLFTIDSVASGQILFFWAYDFQFIPIELISAIYEEFLYQEESGKDGTYYTRLMLVDFMLNQAMPWSDQTYTFKLLDPACGSGIFLVEAYRRLVERWRKVNRRKPEKEELIELLKTSVFGVDIKRQALRVAAFSLYLAMLDYLEPKSIWMKVQFPPLIGTNLIEADFFDEEKVDFAGLKFDLIIGNPPWVSKLTSHARAFLPKHGYRIGDEQIVQAFLWHAPDFCKPNGQIALLCSSKSLLFNRSNKNIAFKRDFFRKFRVTKVFDFSALRRILFPKGIAPACAIFYSAESPNSGSSIFYGAPKLTHLVRRLATMVVEANDLKQLPLRQIWESIDGMSNTSHNNNRTFVTQAVMFDDEEEEEMVQNHSVNIWKVALWGTSYDYILLQELNKHPMLGAIIKQRGWISKVGYNHKGPKEGEQALWLDDALNVAPQHFTRYGIDISKLQRLPRSERYYRRGISEQFKAPLVLFKRTQVDRQIGAAYLDQDCAYSETFTCIAGPDRDRNLLKAVTALLNSEIAQYYLFLTSASWGVEREEVKAGEMKTLPFPFLHISNDQLIVIANLVDKLAQYTVIETNQKEKQTSDSQYLRRIIDEFETELNLSIYRCFNLNEYEIQHIQETIRYTIGFFNNPEKSIALQKPSAKMRQSYAEAYLNSINFYLEPVAKKLIATVFLDETASLQMVQFSSKRLDEDTPNIYTSFPDEHMRRALAGLNKLSNEQAARRIYHRRNFRIYDNDTLYIAKPAEQRLWTSSAALSDAQETIAELIQPMKV